MPDRKTLILVVDDEDVNVRFLTAVLTRRNYDVVAAYDGLTALELFDEKQPDLVLLDVMMPGLDGFEVCRRIKTREDTHFVPIVMVTALDTTQDRVQGIEAGVDDFLTKPIQIEELLARVSTCLKNRELYLQLENSYKQLSGLNFQTEQIMSRFSPMQFNFFSAENQLLKTMMNSYEDDSTRPNMVILGVPAEDGKLDCRIYSPGKELDTFTTQHIRIPKESLETLNRVDSTAFNNFRKDVTPAWIPPKELAHYIDQPENMVLFCDDRILLAGLNYGRPVSRFDAQVLKGMALHHSFFNTIAGQIREVQYAFDYMIDALARASHANDEDTGDHIHRIKSYAALVSRELGFSDKETEVISHSAKMHDVGKIHIHPDILRKTGSLTEGEFEIIKRHTILGAMILGESSRLATAKNIAISHHERWDGTGYPYGLKGTDIPIEGRIVAICDIYDALRSDRPYKEPFNHKDSVEIIAKGDDRTHPDHFDPDIHAVFMKHHELFADIYSAQNE